MQVEEYSSLDGLGLAELVQKGEVTPAELLDLAATQIQSTNPEINAVVTPMGEQARQAIADGRLEALRRDLEGTADTPIP